MLMSTKPFDKEAAHGWKAVMERIKRLRSEGETLEVIGKKLGVSKAAVSRWLSENLGGEKNSFGDMVRYAKTLGITPAEMFGEKAVQISMFDKQVAHELSENIRLAGFSIEDVANMTGVTQKRLGRIVEGQEPPTPEDLFVVCKSINLNPAILLNKAAELANIETNNKAQQTQKSA
ncbi:helix-turn-helix domain-containing protein [Maridesulfovibrio salexigens]|uniref:Transcriptional regulator, XRE family n=1 Tax=Maridesulfovibrio salexigens (strain ATCC 14822 / DSM 2638 / NCIMB 8403 / VKM B-1763) TaxID=526222 RepID=C6BW06_MARSD|nr:helix-turn-helix transcriptional regulator [Maridesulfovibrio salexigens]ACS80209.1 transcriptional regulator, XRE family [Maridesulfovibrio salexigens DSM 2638]